VVDVSIDRLERVVEALAVAVDQDGERALPLFERAEAELAAAREAAGARAETVARARRIAAKRRERGASRCQARR